VETTQIKVKADVNDERVTNGILEIHYFNSGERMINALKKLALYWVISIFSILIPVAHFILVPLFFFLGIFFFYRSYKSQGKVLAGSVPCPHCQKVLTLGPQELQWPVSEICQSCARAIRIHPVLAQ
jgi:hypothetical protein